jgi:hypothetical protein
VNGFLALDPLNRGSLIRATHGFPVASIRKPGGKLTRIGSLKYPNQFPAVAIHFLFSKSGLQIGPSVRSVAAALPMREHEKLLFVLKDTVKERLIELKGESKCRNQPRAATRLPCGR